MRDTLKMLSQWKGNWLATLVALLFAYNPHTQADVSPRIQFPVESFAVEGENPLAAAKTQQILAPFLGEQQGLARIEAAAKALQEVLLDQGYAFHRVIVPPQKVTGGVFKLKVITFQLDNITVKGNRHFSEENILASLPDLRTGETPNSREVARSLMLANEHPAKRVAVFIRESDQPGHLDARVETRDVKPWQLFASLANTGSDETGGERLSVGYQHRNLWSRDHVLTLSYTTSPGHWDDVSQYGAYYRLPFYPWRSSLSVFYTHSDVEQGKVADFFDVSGKGTFQGFNLGYALLPFGDYSHKVTLGLQDHLFENDTTFAGDAFLTDPDVRSRPLSLRYHGRWETTTWTGGFHAEYIRNLSSGSHNDSTAYSANRFGADPHWDALRFGANLDYALPGKWRFKGGYTGQWANEPLIPGEQLGLGGVNSIRGFEERETSGDRGHQLNLEVWAPPIANNIRLLGFLDYGHRHLEEAIAGLKTSDSLASMGVGLRWQWKNQLNLSLDLAHVLNGADPTDSGDGRLHFNVFYRF